MLILVMALSFVLCTWYYLLESVRNAMGKKRWVTAGLLFGPMSLPMFYISKKMNLRKVSGYHLSLIHI